MNQAEIPALSGSTVPVPRRRVLVTGATGFVGAHLVRQLSDSGHDVVVAVRERSDISRLPPSVAAVPFDLAFREPIEPSRLAGIDCVFHLAARVHVMRSGPDDPQCFQQMNVEATESLARSAAAAGVRRMVFLSSIKVNGERTTTVPFSVHDVPRPEDAYGVSKHHAEMKLACVGAKTGLETVVVRPPLVYGPNVGANFRRLLGLAQRALPLPLASIRNSRSLISVWNLVGLLDLVAWHPVAAGGTWLASDNEDVSTPQLINLLARSLDRPARLFPFPVELLKLAGNLTGMHGETMRLIESLRVDTRQTSEALGWQPGLTLSEGIRRTAAWYQEASNAAR